MITYIENFIKPPDDFDAWVESIPWVDRTEARRECFMAGEGGVAYTYGEGRGKRQYISIPATPFVLKVQDQLNELIASLECEGQGRLSGCFLNRYDHKKQALGWHADDAEEMNHNEPIVVASFGAEREIWWRPNGVTGVTPPECKQLLGNGSVFIMPAGFQHTHQHRIPKSDRDVGTRVSLTFRAFR